MAFELKDLGKVKWYFQVLIVAAVCGGLLAGFWYFYLSPMQADVQSKTGKVADLNGVIKKSEAQEKELAKLKQAVAERKAELEMLKANLPQEKETDQIFRAVQLQAAGSGLRVVRVAPRPTVDHEAYTEYPIDLEVIGTYHNVGNFLD